MPTHQQKLQLVRERVIAVCPEIMDLSFGCLIHEGLNNKILMYLEDGINGLEGYIRVAYFGGMGVDFKNGVGVFTGDQFINKNRVLNDDDIYHYKIIGRPITLSHVLRTIKKECEFRWKERGYPIVCGQPEPCNQHNKWFWEWNLTKNLEEQKPKVIDFLFELLK